MKEVRKLGDRRWRDRTGRFLAEGEDLLAAADAAGWAPVARLCATGSGLAGEEVEPSLLDRVSLLGSGTRALAIYEQRWASEATAPCVALWGVADPGNVGTVLRSAAAFGAACVALGPGCADPYSPKAVRASMGAVFAVPLLRAETVAELPGPRVALVARAGKPLHELEPAATLVIGAERAGLPPEVAQACDEVAHIPIETESLNAAMAATVALYERNRMRRPHA